MECPKTSAQIGAMYDIQELLVKYETAEGDNERDALFSHLEVAYKVIQDQAKFIQSQQPEKHASAVALPEVTVIVLKYLPIVINKSGAYNEIQRAIAYLTLSRYMSTLKTTIGVDAAAKQQ